MHIISLMDLINVSQFDFIAKGWARFSIKMLQDAYRPKITLIQTLFSHEKIYLYILYLLDKKKYIYDNPSKLSSLSLGFWDME